MKKAYESARDEGVLVVCFVPARVDTEWWHRYALKADEILYPRGFYSLQVNGQAGLTYLIESADELMAQVSWMPLSSVTITNDIQPVNLNLAGATNRFFRTKVQ